MNLSIYDITGGAARDWMGDVLVLKESMPRSQLHGDVEPKDIDVISEFFRLDGNAPGLTIHFR